MHTLHRLDSTIYPIEDCVLSLSVLIEARLGGTKAQLVLTPARIHSESGIQGNLGVGLGTQKFFCICLRAYGPFTVCGEMKITEIIWDKKWASGSAHRCSGRLSDNDCCTLFIITVGRGSERVNRELRTCQRSVSGPTIVGT
jgi:hypothetical protein